MKCINSKCSGFAGNVIVCGQEVYINTVTGMGFPRVFELMKGYILKIANLHKFMCKYETFDDLKQEICLYILEGILKYDVSQNASLSTFLYMFICSRLADKNRKHKKNFIQLPKELESFDDNPINNIELNKRVEAWDLKWKNIIFRLFVIGEKVNVVASSEGMTPWGLSRAVHRKLEQARKV